MANADLVTLAASAKITDAHTRAVITSAATNTPDTDEIPGPSPPVLARPDGEVIVRASDGKIIDNSVDYRAVDVNSTFALLIEYTGGVAVPIADLIAGTSVDADAVYRDTTNGLFRAHGVSLVDAITMSALSFVDKIHITRPVQPQLDLSAREATEGIKADRLWRGNPPNYPSDATTGKNVVVGIVDSGIDTLHLDFRKPTPNQGQTRILEMWDQTIYSLQYAHPTGFAYGSKITAAQINGWIAAGQQDAFFQPDANAATHGTAIAAIAAGNGQGYTDGAHVGAQWSCVGIAPEADLVIVKTDYQEQSIIDACRYIFGVATTAGKDAVVCLALSTRGTASPGNAHDGSYGLDVQLSSLTGAGKTIIAAAGNYGGNFEHARLTGLTNGETVSVPLAIPTYSPSVSSSEYFEFDGFYPSTAQFSVSVTRPDGTTTPEKALGQTYDSGQDPRGEMILQNGVEVTSTGLKRVRLYVWNGTTLEHPTAGTYLLNVHRTGGSTGTVDFWFSDSHLGTNTAVQFAATPTNAKLAVDNHLTIGSPGSGTNIICIGAYADRASYINYNNQPSGLNPAIGVVPDILKTSARGNRLDGVQKPDIVAPGGFVVAALASQNARNYSNVSKAYDGVHEPVYGTSVAAAHGAGAAACLMQLNNGATVAAMRGYLRGFVRNDTYTGPGTPTIHAGSGKLDFSGATGGGELENVPIKMTIPGNRPNGAPKTQSAPIQTTSRFATSGSPSVTLPIAPATGYAVQDVLLNGESQGPLTSITVTPAWPQHIEVVTRQLPFTGGLGQDVVLPETA